MSDKRTFYFIHLNKKAYCLFSSSNHMKNNIFLLKGVVCSKEHVKNKIDLINQFFKDGILRHQQDKTNKQLLPYKYPPCFVQHCLIGKQEKRKPAPITHRFSPR